MSAVPTNGRPDRFESEDRGELFKDLIAQGMRPDLAARAARVDPFRALRMIGEAIGLTRTAAVAGTGDAPSPAGAIGARGPTGWAP